MAAANPCELEKQQFPAIVDGGACFQLLNPSFNEVNQHCSLDVLPIIFDDVSFPVEEEECGYRGSSGGEVYDVAMLSEGRRSSTVAPPLAVLSLLEFPVPHKKQICLDAQLSCQDFIDLQMEGGDVYRPCIVDIGIEMESVEKTKSEDDTAAGSMKTEGLITGLLQRQASMKSNGSFVQLLTDHSSTLLKFLSKEKSFTERVHDAPNNRWRRCKRAASLDSRKIVLLFSILSSLGTLILIYLTLRVKQTADGFVNS